MTIDTDLDTTSDRLLTEVERQQTRLSARDMWIGWLRQAAAARVHEGELNPRAFGAAMLNRLDASIAAIRWDDLASAREIAQPSETVVLRLQQRAAGAAAAREAQLRAHFDAHGGDEHVPPLRGEVKSAAAETDWRAASEDLLLARVAPRSPRVAQMGRRKTQNRLSGSLILPRSAW